MRAEFRTETRVDKLKQAILDRGLNVFDSLEFYDLDHAWDGIRREQQMHCPGFHGVDRKKSARIYSDTGTMHCFGCDKQYDIFAFEMAIGSKSFPQAVYDLAERYDITVEYDEKKALSISRRIKESLNISKKRRDIDNLLEYLDKFKEILISKRKSISLLDYKRFIILYEELQWGLKKDKLKKEEFNKVFDAMYSNFIKITRKD